MNLHRLLIICMVLFATPILEECEAFIVETIPNPANISDAGAVLLAEARIGDLAGTGEYELGLGTSLSAPVIQDQFIWSDSVSVPLELRYDPIAGESTFTLGSQALVFDLLSLDANTLIFAPRAELINTIASLSNISLDGASVQSFFAARSGSMPALKISDASLSDGFTFNADAELRWFNQSPTPTDSQLGLRFFIIPEPSTLGVMLAASLPLILRAIRHTAE